MADPTVEAAADVLRTALDDLRTAVEGLSADDLNRRPAADTNAIAVIVTHAMHSTRAWLSLGVGADPPARDRPAEFVARASGDADLLRFLDAMAADCHALLDGATYDPERTGLAPWRTGPEAEQPVTAAWALVHALAHLREHVGHAQLTRQLLGAS